ncbi:MAG: hypothetical protein SH821_17400 [Phototrophicales bacterium]|jgi:quercetin dioxygenase-like cupin family protein|nr:hypothetical protein [Phototrophicales bacterium]
MKSTHLLEELEFHDLAPFAQPLLVDKDTRILRWMFKPGQGIDEHTLPNSTLYIVMLKGRGMFSSNGEPEQEFSANTLITFKTNEPHTVRALDEELVFVAFLQPIVIPELDHLAEGYTDHNF